MIPLERLHTITPQQNVKDVLPLMTGQDVNQLAVVQDGQLVGVLTREGILRSLEIRRNLGIDRNRTAS
jgi:CBS domain-containing protein